MAGHICASSPRVAEAHDCESGSSLTNTASIYLKKMMKIRNTTKNIFQNHYDHIGAMPVSEQAVPAFSLPCLPGLLIGPRSAQGVLRGLCTSPKGRVSHYTMHLFFSAPWAPEQGSAQFQLHRHRRPLRSSSGERLGKEPQSPKVGPTLLLPGETC